MKTKILRKKLVVFLLSFMMIIGFIPVTSLAADTETVTITIPTTMQVLSGDLTVAKGQRMKVILTIDEDYHENGDFVKEINNNYQTYGIGISSDVYYPPTFTISGWPNCDIDLTDMAIKKKPQPIIHTVSGKEPRSEGGKGYIVAIENNMEYRLKGTETWTTSKGDYTNHFSEEVEAGQTYEVRYKTNWTQLPSEIMEVYVPRYGQTVREYGFLKSESYPYDGTAHTCEVNEDYTIVAGITTAIDAGTYGISVIPAGDKTWRDGTKGAKTSTWEIKKANQNKPSALFAIKPSSLGAADGKIAGVSEAMEYCKSGDDSWISCTGTEIIGLIAGEYDVRLKEDTNHNASSIAVITVPDGDTSVPNPTPTPTPTPNPTPEATTPTPDPAPATTTPAASTTTTPASSAAAAPAQVTYDILDGAGSSWTQNTDGSLAIRGSGEISKFREVKVDGVTVDPVNYTVTEGSTIITFKPEYLKSLSAGNHSFELVWTDGTAATNFTVAENADQSAKSPKTGEDFSMALCTALLLVSCAGLAGMFVRRKKGSLR
jgi:hypothetical protein